jgi:hypothetical protein
LSLQATEREPLPNLSPAELIYNLQTDKQALKEAVRIAISKRDELYHKVIAYDKALTEESEKLIDREKTISRLEGEKLILEDRLRSAEHSNRSVPEMA